MDRFAGIVASQRQPSPQPSPKSALGVCDDRVGPVPMQIAEASGRRAEGQQFPGLHLLQRPLHLGASRRRSVAAHGQARPLPSRDGPLRIRDDDAAFLAVEPPQGLRRPVKGNGRILEVHFLDQPVQLSGRSSGRIRRFAAPKGPVFQEARSIDVLGLDDLAAVIGDDAREIDLGNHLSEEGGNLAFRCLRRE